MLNSGVYKITNIVNEKVYIGSSINLAQRKQRHFNELRQGIHCNKHLQLSFSKYGEDNFLFEILEYCLVEECIAREQHYLNIYSPSSIDGLYNICLVAGSILGVKLSEETKKKISLSNKGKSKSESHRISLSKAKIGRKNPHSAETIENMKLAAQKRPPVTEETRQKLRISHLEYKPTEEQVRKRAASCQKKVIQLDLFGKVVAIHDSIKIAAKSINVSASCITGYLKGRQKIVRGFTFKYYKDVR